MLHVTPNTFRFRPAKGAERVYYFRQSQHTGLWSSNYWVINPKTGHEWQGVKSDPRLVGTHFACTFYGSDGVVTVGPITEGRFSWSTAPASARGADIGYLTKEALIAAILAC
jgi:hypothetical protein